MDVPIIYCILIFMNCLTEYQMNRMMLDIHVLEKKHLMYHMFCAVFRIFWIAVCGCLAYPLPVFVIGLFVLLFINILPYRTRLLLMINFIMIIFLLFTSFLMLVIGGAGLLGYSFPILMENTTIRITVLCIAFFLHDIVCFLLIRYRPGFLLNEEFDRLKVVIYTLFLSICVLYHLVDSIVLSVYETIRVNYLLLLSGDGLILILMFMFLNNNHVFFRSEMIKKQFEESEVLVAQQFFEKENLKELSGHDPLTSAYNRREICTIMQEQLTSGHKLACVFVDLDGLKRMNDTYGHTFGDMMLKRFADASHLMMKDKGCLARIGGDEFLLVFFDRNIADIETDIKQLQLQLIENKDPKEKIYFSYGISYDETTVDAYITSADQKMYQCKKRKRSGRI